MSVDPNQAKSIFLSAVEGHVPEQWGAYLDRACRGDAELRQRVEALLAAHQGQDKLLDDPELALTGQVSLAEPMETPGTAIGRYKLLEKIGEGGMAVVYMAESATGGPIRRKVALKIIKLGMDTRQVIARFEAERQALALMDHPSIARVLDAGATETGRPYFVMELVQGVSITEYCDKNNLSTKDRLGLFIQVCHAVQHAHQKGIIHRDLKPSNVMVTHHDGKPVPKVIDFGIAKATNQRLTEKTLFTRYAHLIGTPAYMSPEQAELSDLDIDTRSDIYSLGVLLYELLTGTTPFSEEELRKAGYIEMQRVIREQEPMKPSTRIRTARRSTGILPLSSMGVPPMTSDHGQDARGTHGRDGRATHGRDARATQVRGDLDWIVMKSLEKDRARRYDTASGLAEDIRRHLEHEPVAARGPSATYRLRKFLRRYRVQVGIILVIATAAVAVGSILSMWNRDRAQLAEAEGFKHRNILSQAREQYAKADGEAALETIKPILASRHVGREAQLLQATILVDNRRSDEAAAILGNLLDAPPAIAGAAHSLLARILWEGESPNAERLTEIEEHRKKAEALLPETAEAYFLRAMTAITVKEQLASLDLALQLDSGHYESRRLRAYTYYASRKYDRLRDDALVMTILRPRDPLGYSLRAKAWRELGRYPEAIADYGLAIALTPSAEPQHVDLRVQRCEVFLRMGEYDRVIAEAETCLALWPEKPVFRYHRFCALTAFGEYDTATTLFREVIAHGHGSRQEFRDWCAKYVFDTLEGGRSWYPPEQEPVGAAFLPMIEAEETYRSFSAKGGRRLTTDGFRADWSPDGKKLAFSLGVQGYSGVAIYDPATKETDLLIVPGKDPRWSPDGRHIAFVRDRQLLRISELLDAERENRARSVRDEEVWVMKSDGREPRRLVRGGWPSWGSDSEHIYHLSRGDRTLRSISLVGEDMEPDRIMKCPHYLTLPSVSPDDRRVAYLDNTWLKIKDLPSQTKVREQPAPFADWVGPVWSPTGHELCLGGRNDSGDRTGLWIYSVDTSEPARILAGQVTGGAWSQDGTELVFSLGPPYFELWTVGLHPGMPTVEALGPGQTLEEHVQEMVAFYTRRIEVDPQDGYAYSSRAQYHSYLGDRTQASADMRRSSGLLSGELPSDISPAAPRDLRRVIHLPFDCQLALSRERRENGTQVLRVAFGQKGRCEMRLFEIPMFLMSLVGLGLVTGVDTPAAHADFTFGEPEKVASLSSYDIINSISPDGLEMYVESYRSGGFGSNDLWVSRRATIDSEWGPLENLGPGVNAPQDDHLASVSADGLTLYFTSDFRPDGYGYCDIYMATRPTKQDPWGKVVNLGSPINSSTDDFMPWITQDGRELYFSSWRSGGYGRSDIYVVRRLTTNDPWSDPVNLGPAVNGAYCEHFPCLSADELLLLFSDYIQAKTPRPGGYGGCDIWMTRRSSKDSPWQEPVNLGPQINGTSHDGIASISPDGRTVYFNSNRRGSFDAWQASIIPVVDFNGDGTVNLVDMVMLIDNWGSDDSLYDIGPFAWGDGVVDIEDLKVFIAEWEKENPPAQP